MATQPLDRYSLDEYLKLQDEPHSERSEFHDGLVLPLEAATPKHASLSAAVVGLVRSAFFPRCTVYDSSLNLYLAWAGKILNPDATAVCGIQNYPKPNCIDNPAVLVEVTSPSTKDYDFGTKREHYFNLSSVQHYLLVSQSEVMVGHYQRSGEAWLYVDRYADGILLLGEVEIEVNNIYQGIA